MSTKKIEMVIMLTVELDGRCRRAIRARVGLKGYADRSEVEQYLDGVLTANLSEIVHEMEQAHE